ncbi:MAG: rRNA maturation RNase YbeY [Lachnospiraceae bacterium]|nr:rRNA maturation RNase YbeY [Lachnospiraceae bacterium]
MSGRCIFRSRWPFPSPSRASLPWPSLRGLSGIRWAPGDFSQINEEGSDEFDPDSGELLLGDIVINADRVIEQAQEYGHSQRREYAFLIAHSILHLTGYDHMEDEEREQMEERQRSIMEKVGIGR